jgi:hypothetical protein
VSVSLGSARRDQTATLTVAGQTVAVHRVGTDGDLERARAVIAELDGRVDAIGLGGIDLYLTLRDRRYVVRDAVRLKEAARLTPVVDGSGLKAVWEPEVVRRLTRDGILRRGQRVLMVSAMDRYGMASALAEAGLDLVMGDLIFASRIDYPIRSLDELEELARKLLPELVKLPFGQLYPVGEAQESAADPRFGRYFEAADVIAGDFHYIRRYMPDRLDGRIVLTNTTTAEDIERLKAAGVAVVATTTPRLEGRSFGTNLVEAALVAALGVLPDAPDWAQAVLASGLRPDVQRLTGS